MLGDVSCTHPVVVMGMVRWAVGGHHRGSPACWADGGQQALVVWGFINRKYAGGAAAAIGLVALPVTLTTGRGWDASPGPTTLGQGMPLHIAMRAKEGAYLGPM